MNNINDYCVNLVKLMIDFMDNVDRKIQIQNSGGVLGLKTIGGKMKNNMKSLRAVAVGFACVTLMSLSTGFAGTAAADLKKPIMTQDLPAVVPAADAPSSASLPFYTPTWKMGDPMTLANGKVTVDINERIRLEVRNNTFDFNDSKNHVTDDTFVLQRFRLGVKVDPTDWISIYAQGQDARELFSERGNVPFQFAAEGDNGFDLYQGYVDLGNKGKFPVTARLGRQVLSYGDERLIGGFDWNNFGRTFDAAKLTYYIDAPTTTSVDGFISNVVTQEGFDRTDRHNFEFNESNSKDLFAGIYATSKIISFQKTEVYALYRGKEGQGPEYNATGGTGLLPINTAYDVDQDIWTFGARMQSTSPGRLKGFDYTFEGAYQVGTVSAVQATGAAFPGIVGGTSAVNPVRSQGREHLAYAIHAETGYNWELAPWTPRLGVEYNYASGDDNASDAKSGTFMNLFPTNHKFYGYMDAFSWKNMQNAAVTLTAKPNTKTTLRMDYHAFWLADSGDALYRANGVTQVRAANAAARKASTFVGTELDLTASYAYSKYLNFLIGYSHFFAADYLNDTQNTASAVNAPIVPGGDDADFFYFQTVLKL